MKPIRVAIAATLLLVGCHTLVEQSPTGSNGPDATLPQSSPVVVVSPVTIPSPTSGGPTPAPTQSPGSTQPPATQPPATQPPSAQGCHLPAGTGSGASCPRGNYSFLNEVENSINMLVRDHPEIFNLKDGGPCGTCYAIRDYGAYEAGIVRNLQSQGLCAKFDGEEFAVKDSNSFNDQYDLIMADGHIRRQEGSYRGTCRPAWF